MVDVVVVGAGPNGLAAAITCAEAGRSVLVLEATGEIGGGTRTAELTLPGFRHDVCSAIHPLVAISPYFRQAGLERHGLELVHPEVPLAHPLDGGRAGVLHRSIEDTAAGLGVDGRAWDRHVGWVARRWDALADDALGPLLRVPRHPLTLGAFGARGLLPSTLFASRAFRTEEAKGLFAGNAAHSFVPLDKPFTTAAGLMLAAPAHVGGWPMTRGGAQTIATAMTARLAELGGTIEVQRPVRSLRDLPDSRAVLFDVSPRQLVAIVGDELPPRYRRRLTRFRYGPASWKVDYALSEPVPWTNPDCHRAGTVHLGGTLEEVARSEAEVGAGRHPSRPFVLVAQHSRFDDTRAPAGRHTLWTYCHAPHGSDVDLTSAIEDQLERFAPGFRDIVLARHRAGASWFEAHDANLVGGDIAGGANDGLQLPFRPVVGPHPYRTPNRRFFICSASTPPGGGIHGMCGWNAAKLALRTTLR
ncbi:MAG TPA: NAD(P)/FAD-dependent oxidoreductase [Acidimicrobiales bacterium]|nr:NAD(P)/FAD-dependent oxidoreductase [Acidimicrobiales bacterium]